MTALDITKNPTTLNNLIVPRLTSHHLALCSQSVTIAIMPDQRLDGGISLSHKVANPLSAGILVDRFATSCYSATSLIDLIPIDFLSLPNSPNRFQLNYMFLSLRNLRIDAKVTLSDGFKPFSVVKIFSAAAWLEREAWDLFGLFFLGSPDLRRILTDYGFTGFPFRKDFPTVGFKEVRYDGEAVIVAQARVSLSQENRLFSFARPWFDLGERSSVWSDYHLYPLTDVQLRKLLETTPGGDRSLP
jgi:NADH:ubiquinone oxidoreductase subunit C